MPIDIESLPPTITSGEYAELARVRQRTVWDWHNQGRGPQPAKVGSRLLYNRDEVLEFLGLKGR